MLDAILARFSGSAPPPSTSLERLLREIEAAPAGAETAAFFDYDGTIISGYSVGVFYRHRFWQGELGPVELARTALLAMEGIDGPEDFLRFLDLSLANLRGRTEKEVMELGNRLFLDEIGGRLHREVWQLIEAHRRRGHTIVIASSATRFQTEPIAREIGTPHVLCTRLETRNGVLTGKTVGMPVWAEGKARATRDFARANGIDLSSAFAYANGSEDVPFLESVGRPVAVAPSSGLERIARKRTWPILPCEPRGGRPGLAPIARTIGFYGGLAAASGAGLAAGLLNGSRRTAIDLTTSLACDLGLALAGVDVRIVRGAEHLWSARPCVFLINHQSKIDAILAGKLIRERMTGVAKKEVRNVPGFGAFFELAGVAFVDRGNTSQARRAIVPAIEKIREEGLSLVIAPEGTRSPTPRLGRFKKGAFHIAMQAGVPVVPIVFRNAGEVMWRSAQTIHPGTVEVVVLPPIDTSGWKVETLDEHVREVRDLYVSILDAWPGPPSPGAKAKKPKKSPRETPARAGRAPERI